MRSIVALVLALVIALIGVAAIGIVDSKNNQGQNNNDQGCKPGSTKSCYTGPAGTAGVGACMAGTKTCNPDGEWGKCVGQVTPIAEVCDNNKVDEDCDGYVNYGCSCSTPEVMDSVCPVEESVCGSGSYCDGSVCNKCIG